jgi:hypothetical protein
MKINLKETDILNSQIEHLTRELAQTHLRLAQAQATLQALAVEVEKLPEIESNA